MMTQACGWPNPHGGRAGLTFKGAPRERGWADLGICGDGVWGIYLQPPDGALTA